MILRESEPTRLLDVPVISPKTSVETLQRWAGEHWRIGGRKGVTQNIIENVRELRIVNEYELNTVLLSIRYFKPNSLYTGEDAIAVDSARLIGGLGALANWPMHAPQMVYLSARCVGAMEERGDEPKALKIKISKGAINYAKEYLPSPDLYIEILDFLSQPRNRTGRTSKGFIEKAISLLGEGNVEVAHRLMNESFTRFR